MNSLGGNSNTSIIIALSPSPIHDQETLRSLRYGARAKNIKNQVKKNEEYSNEELKNLLEKSKDEVAELMKNNAILKH